MRHVAVDSFAIADVRLHSTISYPNYKFIFPIKALGMYGRRFGEAQSNSSL